MDINEVEKKVEDEVIVFWTNTKKFITATIGVILPVIYANSDEILGYLKTIDMKYWIAGLCALSFLTMYKKK